MTSYVPQPQTCPRSNPNLVRTSQCYGRRRSNRNAVCLSVALKTVAVPTADRFWIFRFNAGYSDPHIAVLRLDNSVRVSANRRWLRRRPSNGRSFQKDRSIGSRRAMKRDNRRHQPGPWRWRYLPKERIERRRIEGGHRAYLPRDTHRLSERFY